MEYDGFGRHGQTCLSSRALDLRSREMAQWGFFSKEYFFGTLYRGDTTFCQNECSVESFPRDEVLDDPDASVDKIPSM